MFKLDNNELKLSKREKGNQLEDFAVKYLIEHECKILERNFQCKLGEIDIIVMDGNVLSFIEVRYRKQSHYGGAIASVDKKKQSKIINTANVYLQKNKLINKIVCRFDVFAIQSLTKETLTTHKDIYQYDVNWIKQAFYAE